MPTVFVAAGFALVAWATGNMNFANYLHIPYLRHAGELVIVCTAIVGAGLGFLWFNTYPAQVLWATSVHWRSAARWALSPCCCVRSSCW